ncbi:MAG: hypothetical protein AAB534_02390 [Patescibacteria group bacterium]
MKNKIIAIIIIVLVLIGLFYLLSVNKTIAPTTEPVVQNTEPVNIPKEADKNDVKRVMETTEQTEIEFENSHTFSPNKKYKVVLAERLEEGDKNYITDDQGNRLTNDEWGYFIGWTSDSTKVILYASWDLKIYYLDIQGNYYDAGLPRDTYSAAYSPKDKSISYVTGANSVDLYLRSNDGSDRVIVEGYGSSGFDYIKWSPLGNKIAFLTYNLNSPQETSYLVIIDSDGSNLTYIHNADWIPFRWSEDGSIITFINDGYVWEYKVIK